MTGLLLTLALSIVVIIWLVHKQHWDSKHGMTALLWLIPRDRFAPPIARDVSKSWWDIIGGVVRVIILGGLVIGILMMCRWIPV